MEAATKIVELGYGPRRLFVPVPVVVFLWKVIIWDKVFGLGTTDDLSTNLWYVTMMVLGFYYVHWTVGRFKR